MKNELYLEIIDVLDTVSNRFSESDIFNVLKNRIHTFTKEVIETSLAERLDEVLQDLYLPLEHRLILSTGNLPDYIYLADHFSEYLEFRYHNDNVFGQKENFIYAKNVEHIKHNSIQDFRILNNMFLDALSFYFYGWIDPCDNNTPLEDGLKENQLIIRGIEGGSICINYLGLKVNGCYYRQIFENGVKCLFYGQVSFRSILTANIDTYSVFQLPD